MYQPTALRDSKSERWTNRGHRDCNRLLGALSNSSIAQHRKVRRSEAPRFEPTAPIEPVFLKRRPGGVRCYDAIPAIHLGCDCCLSRNRLSGPKLNRAELHSRFRWDSGYPLIAHWPTTTASEAGGIRAHGQVRLRR